MVIVVMMRSLIKGKREYDNRSRNPVAMTRASLREILCMSRKTQHITEVFILSEPLRELDNRSAADKSAFYREFLAELPIRYFMKYSFKRRNEISLRKFEEQIREQERILRGSASLRGTDSCTSVRTLQQDLRTVVMR